MKVIISIITITPTLLLLLLIGCSVVNAQLVIDLFEDEEDVTLSSSSNNDNNNRRRSLQPVFDDTNHIDNLLNLDSITIRHTTTTKRKKKKQQRNLALVPQGLEDEQDDVEGEDTIVEETTKISTTATTKYVQYGSHTGPSYYKEDTEEDVTYWHGIAEDGVFGFASFTKQGNYSAATFSTTQETYTLVTLHDGSSHTMHVMKWKDMAIRDPYLQLQYNMNTTSFTKRNEKNNQDLHRSLLRTTTTPAMVTTTNQTTNEQDDDEVKMSFQLSLQQLKNRYQEQQRNLAAKTDIDILVIASQQATCVVAGRSRSCTNPDENPIRTQINNNLSVLNNAVDKVLVPVKFNMVRFEVSGIPNAKIVQAHERSKTETFITNWANQAGADLIMLIVDPTDSNDVVDGTVTEIGGIAEPGEASGSKGYSALNSKYLGAYQFSYNVGRNIGCRPQKEYFTSNERRAPNTFNYALEQYDDTKSDYRTIMGLPCQKPPYEDCPIAPYFSARDFQIYFKDLKTNVNLGGPTNDNAKYIVDNRQKTANRRPTGGTGSGGGSSPDCFSSSNTVNVLGKGVINIDELQIGDYVQDVVHKYNNNNNNKQQDYHYSRVYSFAHYDNYMERPFLEIQFVNDNYELQPPLEISFEHLVYVIPQQGNNNKKKKQRLVRAEDVQVGDIFYYYNYNTNKKQDIMMIVKSIQTIQRRGAYAPITESGTIIVSGIPASVYNAKMGYNHWFQHILAHMLLSPLRIICNNITFDFCINETYIDGISEHYWYILQFFLYLRTNYNPTIQLILTMIGVPIMIVAYITEQLIYYYPILGVTIVGIITMIISAARRNKKTKLD